MFRLRPRPSVDPVTPLTLTRLVPGTRWLVCTTTSCAHNTTRHVPAGTGYRCTNCGTTKGDQS